MLVAREKIEKKDFEENRNKKVKKWGRKKLKISNKRKRCNNKSN